MEDKHPAQAALVLEKAAKLEPNKASIREALGQAYYNYGEFLRARKHFRKALEIHPTNDYCHFGLALSYYKQAKNLTQARKHIKLALAMNPECEEYQKAYQLIGKKAKE